MGRSPQPQTIEYLASVLTSALRLEMHPVLDSWGNPSQWSNSWLTRGGVPMCKLCRILLELKRGT